MSTSVLEPLLDVVRPLRRRQLRAPHTLLHQSDVVFRSFKFERRELVRFKVTHHNDCLLSGNTTGMCALIKLNVVIVDASSKERCQFI